MADLSKCQYNNWLLYLPQNQYCTFVSQKDENVIVETFNGQLICNTDQLTFIKVTTHIVSSCQFLLSSNDYSKKVDNIDLKVSFNNEKAYISANDGHLNLVAHVHTLQNTYKDLTGQTLEVSLYGTPYPEV